MARNIRVWDIPRKIFEEISSGFRAVSETEIDFYPRAREIRTFRSLDPRRIGFKNLICLQTFPKTEEAELRTAFYLWIGNSIEGEYDGNMEELASRSFVIIDGLRSISGPYDEDKLEIRLPQFWIEAQPNIIYMVSYVIMMARALVISPGFVKMKYPGPVKYLK